MNLGELLEETLRPFRRIARTNGIRLEIDLSETLTSIETDGRRLRQVLANLLSNAMKFTPAGGSVTLQARWKRQSDTVEISVADTGIGIAAEDIPLTLTPFGRVGGAIDAKYPGTDLRLPLSRRFVEALGGSFSIESHVGIGTRVSARLPRGCRATLAVAPRSAA